ncbi:MAG: Alkaline phosphatase D [Acidimicrobiales bacterium]|nr:Alkaline phosphatase D [Acidimicrobiales bacterium]RIK07629.1 MAG: alkaline phosphatase [Acidobacteriota bacterium]
MKADRGVRPHDLSRRAFLGATIAGVVAAACSGKDGASDGGTSSSSVPLEVPGVDVEGDLFALGVASGDPTADSVILWTRLAPDPMNGGGMPDEVVKVVWEVSTDEAFSGLVATGAVDALPELAHSVHVDASGLQPATGYYYRFRVGEAVSPVGRTRTFPAADSSPERLRFAMASCQNYQDGYFSAYRHMLDEDIEFVLFLGDYIYEYGPDQVESLFRIRDHAGGEAVTLDDYRLRYAQYRGEQELREAHARVPWLTIWDDHEVENNYEGDVSEEDVSEEEFRQRRAAAYQAYYEHMPMRIDDTESFEEVHTYRAAPYGDLVDIVLLDVKQFGDPPECRDSSLFDFGPLCDEALDEQRTLLGTEQEAWLEEALLSSESQWNLIVQQILMSGFKAPDPAGGEPRFYLESWDGYPAARQRLAQFLVDEDIRNPVILSGDYHASFVADLKPDPYDPESPVAAPEFLVTSISAAVFDEDYTSANPQVKYFDPRNGYVVCQVTPDEFTTTFRYVSDVTDPAAELVEGPTWSVAAGERSARQE